MAIQKEIWVNDIVEGLYADNQFLGFATAADEFVIQGKILHIPQAGSASDIEQDVTNFPMEASERGDSDLMMPLTNFYVKPVRIPKVDEYELSYAKRQSVMAENQASLSEKVGSKVLYNWAAASGYLNTAGEQVLSPAIKRAATTGTSRESFLSGTTGNRKGLSRQDVANAAKMLDSQNVPSANRVALLTPQHYYDIFGDDVIVRRDVTNEVNIAKGVINELFGFKFMVRSKVLSYTDAGVAKDMSLKTYNTADATDCEASVFWHPTSVYKAIGSVDVFERENDPLYFGSIVSFMVRASGIKKRQDNKGIVSIFDAPVN